jgi:uncharacterized protein (DUF2252 family)
MTTTTSSADPAAPTVPMSLARGASRQGRVAWGKSVRKQVPRSAHAAWEPPAGRREPVDLLRESNEGRIEHLLPIRYGRMLASPFAFFRGAAALMASDLAATPDTGIRVQACGDCHLVNFGGFATPERNVLFDINDFDETLPAPWEWDVKRLATSAVIAARHNGLGRKAGRQAAAAAVRAYREQMLTLAGMRELEIWYERVDASDVIDGTGSKALRRWRRRALRKAAPAAPGLEDYPRLATEEGNARRIRERPPLIYHPGDEESPAFEQEMRRILTRYRSSLSDEKRVLLDRFEFADAAVKAVGVGSLGTVCGVVLLMAADNDPLFLQVREARRSVLEPYAGPGEYLHQGQRVVGGQRLLQAATDLFLRWTDGESGRHYYVRQVRDAKVKPRVDAWDAETLEEFAGWCGGVLARAHARGGDPAVLAGYLGQGEPFDRAVTDFAELYADQNDRDYQALREAVERGVVEAATEAAPPDA